MSPQQQSQQDENNSPLLSQNTQSSQSVPVAETSTNINNSNSRHEFASLEVQRISGHFKITLAILVVLNIVLYTFESVVGAALEPSAHDMILLMLGYLCQDMQRVNGLVLYKKLTIASLVIDCISLITTISFVVEMSGGFHLILLLLIALFLFEAFFKVASFKHSDNLIRAIESSKLSEIMAV
ncbi:hypothetical protein MIR68_010832 [Amoeboaphelidium protococcarum]|nr:hypothetical protein MIR68_010832 [Amoeboaphelidium protococcarum]